MKKNIIFLLLIFLLIVVFFALNSIWTSEKKESDYSMQNDTIFTGIILNLNASGNHNFGIIKLKLKESNHQNFINSEIIYPYQIKDSIAEVYHAISYKLHIGMTVKVDSNKQMVSFYDSGRLIYSSDLTIITNDTDKEFVINNTEISNSLAIFGETFIIHLIIFKRRNCKNA